MTATETAALLRNWEEALGDVLREILAGSPVPHTPAALSAPCAPVTSAHSGAPDAVQDAAAVQGGMQEARSHRRRKVRPTVASSPEHMVTLCPSAVTIAAPAGHEGGVEIAARGMQADQEDGREVAWVVRRSGGKARVFIEGQGAGYRIYVRRLHSDLCWCRQVPAVSVEWVVDITGREKVIGQLGMALALALDGHLPVFPGGLTLQSRFHGLVERRENRVSAAADQEDGDGRLTLRLLFSSILIAD